MLGGCFYKKVLFSTILSLYCSCFFSQTRKDLTPLEIQSASHLCRVWGFLKYYHPSVQKGKIDWDSTLLSNIPKVTHANHQEFNQIIHQLILSLGKVKKLDKPYKYLPSDTSFNIFTFQTTINDEFLDEENRKLLSEVIENYVPKWNTYFDKEFNKYYQGKKGPDNYYSANNYFPDSTHALQSLFRYWNVIEYFYAYRNIIDQNWDSLLVEFIPKVYKSAGTSDFYKIMAELITKTNDCHAYYDNYIFNRQIGMIKTAADTARKVPLIVRYIDNKTVITRIRVPVIKETGLKRGDIILSINGISIEEIRSTLKRYCGCSTEPSVEREIDNGIFLSYFAPKGAKLVITIETPSGNVKTVSFINDKLGEWKYENGDSFVNLRRKGKKILMNGDSAVRHISDSIGFINLTYITSQKKLNKAIKYLHNTKYLIVDFRGHCPFPLFYLPIHDKKKRQVFANLYHINAKYPGSFKLYRDKTTRDFYSLFHRTYKGKILFLINENVQSQEEFELMELRAKYDITLVGSNTSGTDGEASTFVIQNNFISYFTVDAVFFPDDSPTQRVGIKPDIFCTPTIQSIQQGKDAVLDQAIDFIKK